MPPKIVSKLPGNVKKVNVSHEKAVEKRKELKEQGWLSAHYYTRHGFNVDKLRAIAIAGEVPALCLITDGYATTWYYKEADAQALKAAGRC